MKTGIYKITNKVNGKIYIGQSKDIERRFKHHKALYSDFAIHQALKKYGIENFIFEVLYECQIEEMNKWETFYITIFGSLSPKGYNLNMGGDGKEISEETKKKMSESRRKQIRPKCKDETKVKIGNANRGKKHTEETKQKWSDQRKGTKTGKENPMFGKTHSKDVKSLLSEKSSGSNNPMFGRTGISNPTAKNIEIDGIEYCGLRETAKKLNITYNQIKSRLKSDSYPNYKYR